MSDVRSHLLQMRGLKLEKTFRKQLKKMSHLLQMRGLKLICPYIFLHTILSHLLQMRGLKPYPVHILSTSKPSRIFYRCVD